MASPTSSNPTAHAVEIRNVTKTFGRHTAVDDLSLLVPHGTIYGFIGPNGSGKTTTLRMIMHILHPDRGQIRVLGQERHAAANDRVSYLPEERSIYKGMKVRDCLRYFARLKGHNPDNGEIDVWLDRMFPGEGSTRVANLKVEALSKGMNQKVQFLTAVISRPQLVLLDEPFSGLDPVNAVVLRDLILDLKRQGTTVIFSTHDMAVAERMCDAIFMIYKGRKVLDGTLEQIQATYGSDVIHVRLASNGSEPFADLPGVVKVTDFGKWQELRVTRDADAQQILQRLLQRGAVTHFEVARPSLQDIFVRIASPDVKDRPLETETVLA